MSLVFVNHPFSLDHMLRTSVLLEMLCSLESSFVFNLSKIHSQ